LPKGSEERRVLLAHAKNAIQEHEVVMLPGLDWRRTTRLFEDSMDKWMGGISQYRDLMEGLYALANRAGPEYSGVKDLAKRGMSTADKQLEPVRMGIQDDLYSILMEMPHRD